MASIKLTTEQPDFEAKAVAFVRDSATALDPLRREEAGRLVGVLVSNVEMHATTTEFEVIVDQDEPTGIRVSVAHLHHEPLQDPQPGSGFKTLDELSLGWGYEYEDSRLVVWFVVPQPGTTTLDDDLSDEELFEAMDVDPGAASDELIRRHEPLATRIAKRYRGKGIPDEDLDQVAKMALLTAIQRYNPDYGDIRPYAAVTISGELKKKLRDDGWDLNVPRSVQKDVMEVGEAIERLAQNLGRRPTNEEVAEDIGVEDSDVAEAMRARQAYEADSIHQARRESPATPLYTVSADDETPITPEDRVLLEEAISILPHRQRWILDLRVNHDMTQAEIAEIVGVSQMHVSRLLGEAVQIMQDHLGVH